MGKHKDKSHKKDKERHGESSSSSKRRRDSSSEEEEYEKMEKERLRDLKERDEFSERLKRRDKDKTKTVMGKTSMTYLAMIINSLMIVLFILQTLKPTKKPPKDSNLKLWTETACFQICEKNLEELIWRKERMKKCRSWRLISWMMNIFLIHKGRVSIN